VIYSLGAVTWVRRDSIGFVIAANAKQRSLLSGVFPHLAQFFRFIHHGSAFRLILPALRLALVLVPLFLLSCLFFLTFGKSRSSSWHTQSPRFSIFIMAGYVKG
jgi:hypothetical protein